MLVVLCIIIGAALAVALYALAECIEHKVRETKEDAYFDPQRGRVTSLGPNQTIGVADIFGDPKTDHPITRLPSGDDADQGHVETIAGEG